MDCSGLKSILGVGRNKNLVQQGRGSLLEPLPCFCNDYLLHRKVYYKIKVFVKVMVDRNSAAASSR